jgi:hypothetical protein
MTDVLVDRVLTPPRSREDVYGMALEAGGCYDLYRVDWHGSMLTEAGARLMCHFESADTESIRQAVRQTANEEWVMHPVTVHASPENADLDPNVAVERSWDEPVEMADIQAIEDEGAWCLEARNVKFVRTYFTTDRKRMVCLYSAPDAESVRQAQSQINMPMDRVWAFELLDPSGMANTTVD